MIAGINVNQGNQYKMIKKRFSNIMAWVWLLSGILYDFWIQVVPGKWLIDSDMASEMVLAAQLNREHTIISRNWYYSTELRCFETNLFYKIGLAIYPDNWHRARIIAACLLICLLVIAALIFAGVIHMTGTQSALFAGFLVWPFGYYHFFYTIWGSWYITYTVYSLLILSAVFYLSRSDNVFLNWKTFVVLFAGLALSIMSGLNGVRQQMVLFVPMLLGVIILLLFKNKGRKQFLYGVIMMAANGAGYLINMLYFSKVYNFTDMSEKIWLSNGTGLIKVIRDFVFQFGFISESKLISSQGVSTALGIVIGIIIMLAVFVSTRNVLFKNGNESIEISIIAMVLLCGLLIDGVIYGNVNYYSKQYWDPLIPLAVVLLIYYIPEFCNYIKLEERFFKVAKLSRCGMAYVILMCAVTFVSVNTVAHEINSPTYANSTYTAVEEWLLKNNYSKGYASFWNSNVITELSDGRIEMWNMYSTNSKDVWLWLQNTSHNEPPAEPFFFLFNRLTDGPIADCQLINIDGAEMAYENDYISIWTFDDPNLFIEQLSYR